ncbi:MAG: hypothetical protein N2688_11035, partial [Burkholderiaceae bacterium]|nr:hypothetical protein [Burkholderiaceae bacterium]
DHGGAYFAPQNAAPMIETAREFVCAVGGRFHSYAVHWMTGDATSQSLAESIGDHLFGLVDQYREAALTAAQGKRAESALARRAEQARQLQAQIEFHSDLLGSMAQALKRKLIEAQHEAARVAAQTIAAKV